MLLEAKNQSELNFNFLAPRGEINLIWVHGWFHLGLVHSCGVHFIQLKIGSPRDLFHNGQYKLRIDPSHILLQNKKWQLVLSLVSCVKDPWASHFGGIKRNIKAKRQDSFCPHHGSLCKPAPRPFSCHIFPIFWESFCQILENFETFKNFLPHLNSERKEKKRVGHHFAQLECCWTCFT